MKQKDVDALILSFPDVERGTSYGYPSFKVAGKFFTRIRSEDDSVVLTDVGFDERKMLMEAEPQTFHVTPHYQNYPTVLARIETIDKKALKAMLARIWRRKAPKALVKAFDAANKE
ncbi:MAG TPA: MmcQ/YjbR family DNA-binding protein [Caulobacteraceae bacterium]|jgi:hypothetical protein|nr:MmcQ/YjbR family DNA-binding protein [Caulobacteraceae bacterium]